MGGLVGWVVGRRKRRRNESISSVTLLTCTAAAGGRLYAVAPTYLKRFSKALSSAATRVPPVFETLS